MTLEIEDLTKVYRNGTRANDGINLRLAAGEVLGLLGHNGAGKTTLLHQVVGLLRPTSGHIRIDGVDVVARPARARRWCSLQPQGQAPLDGVTPREAIELMARLRGAGRVRARRRAAELLAALELERWAETAGERLSGGVQRLTGFAMAAAEPGRVVMLDEPTNDVDPVRRRLLWAQVRALGEQGCAVVLVTHNVVEAERAVARLVILDRGRVVAQGTPAELRGDPANRLRLELVAAAAAAVATLVRRPPAGLRATRPAAPGRRVTVVLTPEAADRALVWAQQERAAGRLEEFSLAPVSLEEIYINLVGAGAEGGRPPADATQEVENAGLAA